MAVWDRVLSLDEIHALYREPLVDEDRLGDACDPCPYTTDPTCAPTTCLDEDGDGYGVPGASACSAGHPELFDCDDHNGAVHPGAVESCDGIDNNCNGLVDDMCLGAPQATKYHYNAFNQLVKSGVSTICAANDADCDGIPDSQDNCPHVYNPGQEDSDKGLASPLAKDATAVWGFEEASGTVAKDGIGGHDGVLVNGATRAAGRFGQALKLDGVDDRVSISNLTRSTSAFSVELWANLSNAGKNPTMVEFGSTQPLFDLNGNKLRVIPPSVSTYGSVPSNQWTHVAATWDGTVLRYYVSGSEVGNTTNSPGSTSAGVTIGSRKGGESPSSGLIDDVAVFSRALSASEVQAHSQNRLTGDGLGDARDPCPNSTDPTCGIATCIDNDGDGYGIQGASNCSAGHPELFDCDDNNAAVHPGAFDIPWDGVDNDCNGYADEPMQPKTTYQWDGNGNLVGDGTATYTWDSRDRLTTTTRTPAYSYDSNNLRTAMGEQKVLLDGLEEGREYGANLMRYEHDPSRVDGLLAQKTSAGKGYFITDALGSVYAVVDSTGAEVSKYSYDVYGARTAVSEAMPTAWGFTGRRHDSVAEMYFRTREYGTNIGGWSSPDSFATHLGFNRYSYASGVPTRKTDWSGYFPTADSSNVHFGKIDRAIQNALIYLFVDLNAAASFQYLTYESTSMYGSGNWRWRVFNWEESLVKFFAVASDTIVTTTCDISVAQGDRARTDRLMGDRFVVEIANDWMVNDDDRIASTVLHELIHVGLWGRQGSEQEARVVTWGSNPKWSRRSPGTPRNLWGEYVDELTEVVAYTAEAIIGTENDKDIVPMFAF